MPRTNPPVPSATAVGTWLLLAASGVQVARNSVNGAGDATEAALATVTVPAGAMGANGILRVIATFDSTDSANGKTHRIRFGWVDAATPGASGYGLAVTTNAGTRAIAMLQNRNNAAVNLLGANGANNGGWGLTTAINTTTVNTANAFNIAFTSAWAGATSGETNTLEGYTVEVFYQP